MSGFFRFFFVRPRRPPISTRTATPFPCTTLFRSLGADRHDRAVIALDPLALGELEDELALLLGRHQRGFVGLAFGDVDRDPGKALRLAVAAEGASTAGMNPAPGATLDTDAIFDRIFAAGREDPADLRAHPIEIGGMEPIGREHV